MNISCTINHENILDLFVASLLPARCLPGSQHHPFKTAFYRHQFSESPGTDQATITLYATWSPVSLWNILCFQDSLEQSSIHWSSRKETWVLVPTWYHCPRWASHACHAQSCSDPKTWAQVKVQDKHTDASHPHLLDFQSIEGMWREREGNFVKSWHFMGWSVQPVTWKPLRNVSESNGYFSTCLESSLHLEIGYLKVTFPQRYLIEVAYVIMIQ